MLHNISFFFWQWQHSPRLTLLYITAYFAKGLQGVLTGRLHTWLEDLISMKSLSFAAGGGNQEAL